jgi:hypothetical protein
MLDESTCPAFTFGSYELVSTSPSALRYRTMISRPQRVQIRTSSWAFRHRAKGRDGRVGEAGNRQAVSRSHQLSYKSAEHSRYDVDDHVNDGCNRLHATSIGTILRNCNHTHSRAQINPWVDS